MSAPTNICDLAKALAASMAAKDASGSPFSKRLQAAYNLAGVFQDTPAEVKAAGVQVVVAPKEFDDEAVARNQYQDDYQLDVYFQAMVDTGAGKLASAEAMIGLMAEVLQWLRGKVVAAGGVNFYWISSKVPLLYDVQKLSEGIFRSSVVTIYRVLA